MRAAVLLIGCLSMAPAGALRAQSTGRAGAAAVPRPEVLRRTPGPAWVRVRTPHFDLAVERTRAVPLAPHALADSLEAAWTHAVRLLGGGAPPGPRVPILVTASRTRFAPPLSTSNKGLTVGAPPGRPELILLVHNDSVRAYTRHEVLHLVAGRRWGASATPWVAEGLATWADGRCQGAPVVAVARDLLQREPGLDAGTLAQTFLARVTRDRASAYVLAGSLAGYVVARGGLAGLEAVWQGRARLPAPSSWSADTLTGPWRAWVAQQAGSAAGVSHPALARRGCG